MAFSRTVSCVLISFYNLIYLTFRLVCGITWMFSFIEKWQTIYSLQNLPGNSFCSNFLVKYFVEGMQVLFSGWKNFFLVWKHICVVGNFLVISVLREIYFLARSGECKSSSLHRAKKDTDLVPLLNNRKTTDVHSCSSNNRILGDLASEPHSCGQPQVTWYLRF